MLNRVKKLPTDFVWGGATAAYQVEGSTTADGKGKTMWDDYLKEQGRFSPDPASDFYHRYPEDLALAQKYGLNAVRVSIAWTRIFPTGTGQVNKAGVEYYHQLFAECLKNHITPYVTLHHFDSPKPLFEQGDWLNRKTIDAFVDYAKFCFQEFSEVKNWFTINELISLAYSQYVQGNFPPNHKFDFSSAIQAEHNEVLAHAKVVNLYKSMHLGGRIGLIHVVQPAYPIKPSDENQHAADLYNAFMWRFLMDESFIGRPTAKTMALINEVLKANDAVLKATEADFQEMEKAASQNDLFGLNYYQSSFVQAYDGKNEAHFNGTGQKGTSSMKIQGVGEIVKNPNVPTTDWDWNIYPEGLYDILKTFTRDYPNLPTVYITENGLGYKDPAPQGDQVIDDQPRIDYLDQHVDAVLRARSEGVNVQGYFIWSLQDQFSWANGYNKRYGLFYVDFKTQKRYIKKSALWYQTLAETMRNHVSE